jgi:hypothetical protein
LRHANSNEREIPWRRAVARPGASRQSSPRRSAASPPPTTAGAAQAPPPRAEQSAPHSPPPQDVLIEIGTSAWSLSGARPGGARRKGLRGSWKERSNDA